MTYPDRTEDQFPATDGPGAPVEPAASAPVPAAQAPAAQAPAAQAPAAQAPAAPPAAAAPARLPRQHTVKRSRLGGAWVGLVLGAVVLILLLIFILENGHKVDISFFGAHAHLPLGVALLFAAALGVLMVVIPGTGRIIQLRRTARRHRKSDTKAAAAPPPAAPQPPATTPADGTAIER
jgi:lipopolysaccharide assembly protein A